MEPLKRLFVFLVIFTPTLYFDSFIGFFGFSLYGFIVSASILTLIIGKITVQLSDLYKVVAFLALMLCSIAVQYFLGNVTSHTIKNCVVVVTCSVLAMMMIDPLRANARFMRQALYIAIWIHISIFFIQLISWYLFRYDFDVGKLLGGMGHRAFYTANIFRPTGVFDEPSIYGIYVLALAVALFIIERKFSFTIFAALITLPLTFSFTSIALFAACITLVRARSWTLFAVLGILAIPFVLMAPAILDILDAVVLRLGNLANSQDGSTEWKMMMINHILSDPLISAFGFGLEGFQKGISPPYAEAMYDLTLLGSSISAFGFVFGLPMFLVYCSLFRNRVTVITGLLLALVFLKLSVYHTPFFWIFTALVISASKYSQDSLKNEISSERSVQPYIQTSAQ